MASFKDHPTNEGQFPRFDKPVFKFEQNQGGEKHNAQIIKAFGG